MMKFQSNPDEVDHAVVALPAPRFHFGHMARRAFGTIGRWMERSRQRRDLENLDDRLLKDIGITRSEAMHEADMPFWR